MQLAKIISILILLALLLVFQANKINATEDAVVNDADTIWNMDTSSPSLDLLDSTDAPTTNHIKWAFISHADAVWQSGLQESDGEASTCSNNQKDLGETDVDCGGVCVAKCADGKICSVNVDCQSRKCEGGICVAQIQTPNIEIVSDTSNLVVERNANAVLAWVYPGWDPQIDGASWIWPITLQ